jgi:hypothetical protein
MYVSARIIQCSISAVGSLRLVANCSYERKDGSSERTDGAVKVEAVIQRHSGPATDTNIHEDIDSSFDFDLRIVSVNKKISIVTFTLFGQNMIA